MNYVYYYLIKKCIAEGRLKKAEYYARRFGYIKGELKMEELS